MGGMCVLGDTGPGGGIVFYAADDGFASLGSDCGSTCRYLEVAPTDQSAGSSWTGIQFDCMSTRNSSCMWGKSIYSMSEKASARVSSQAIGMGMAASNLIYERISATGLPASAYAAGVALEYANNGKSDWHLPSKAEIEALYAQRTLVPGIDGSDLTYQSSTEVDDSNVWVVTMSPRGGRAALKRILFRVRAVRAFAPMDGVSATTQLPVLATLPPSNPEE